jgi:hypothetical protein
MHLALLKLGFDRQSILAMPEAVAEAYLTVYGRITGESKGKRTTYLVRRTKK